MAEIFLELLNTSIVSSWIILCLLLVRRLFRRASKGILRLLWIGVFVRLIMPVYWVTHYDPFSLSPFTAPPIPTKILYESSPQIHSGIPVIDQSAAASLPAATPAASVNPMQIWASLGAIVWITGMVLMLLYGIISVIRLYRSLRKAVKLERGVYMAENLQTPFVLGLFPARIYLPPGLTEEERDLVLTHERTHIKSLHHIGKFFSYLVLCVHWFNPLVWLAFRRLSEDVEMSCDEIVLYRLGEDAAKPYSTLLLSLSTERRGLDIPLAFGECCVKNRIERIYAKKMPAPLSILGLLLVFFLFIGLSKPPADLQKNMDWLRSLRPEEVSSISLAVNEGSDGERYREYTKEEIVEILQFLNGAGGSPLRFPKEAVSGRVQSFSIETTDGGLHIVENQGNEQLRIDATVYGASDWLRSWDFSGNTPLPEAPPPLDGASETNEGILFSCQDSDLLNVGKAAADAYFKRLMTADEKNRIAGYDTQSLSLLAGDARRFCVAAEFSFTSANANYSNPLLSLTGLGSFENCRLEFLISPYGDGYVIEQIASDGLSKGLDAKTATPETLKQFAAKKDALAWEDLNGFSCTELMPTGLYSRVYPVAGTDCELFLCGTMLTGEPLFANLESRVYSDLVLDIRESDWEHLKELLEYKPSKLPMDTD